ncbi:MAG: NAD-dependent epimerase/dehydratase family protein [Planctomycetota bacterium]
MSKFIVTGGAGFIGSHLCERLLGDGHDVIALDNFDDFYDPQVKRRNLRSVATHPKFRLLEGDIRDAEFVTRFIDDRIHAVIHLAARAGVRPSIEQPLLYQDVNVNGTLVLLEACRRHPHCKFIFGSSSSVYGNNVKVPFSESDRVDDPISPYAATKRAGELLCYTYHHLYGIPMTCLRFFTVFGPRQRPDLAIHKFTRLIESGKPIPMYGDGSMKRDFTYVDDIVDGVCAALKTCDAYRIYNLGNSHPLALRDLINVLQNSLGKPAKIEQLPPQPGDVERTFADIALARKDLGFEPRVNLEKGIARFVQWFRDESKQSTYQQELLATR